MSWLKKYLNCQQFKPYYLSIFLLLFIAPISVLAQPKEKNSNFWPVYRDDQAGFRISYPPSWVVVQPKGRNVKFSVNPPDGPGNCNILVRNNSEIGGMSQEILSREVESLPQNQDSWAEYLGLPRSQIRVIESRIARIIDIPALIGVIETNLETLEGKYLRKQIVVLTFTPGTIWSLNCGASSFNAEEARSRFNALMPSLNKILGSFMFLR